MKRPTENGFSGRCFVGIDLGSTTTKAIVLDEDGTVQGRGITNSRSNYDVACQFATHEAFVDARFNAFSSRLDRIPELSDRRDAVVQGLQRGFRLEQYLQQLDALEAQCRVNGERSTLPGAELEKVLDQLFERLGELAEEHFGGSGKPRSEFFRDIAGADYMSVSGRLAKLHDLDHEGLIALFDKSIIAVEAAPPSHDLSDTLEAALEHALRETPLEYGLCKAIEDEVRTVAASPLTAQITVGTGYGRARLPFPKEHIRSEILCHGLGAHATFPGTRTVLDIGGQDTKAIQVDDEGVVTSFQMNDRCAAGCGRYLGYIADEMNLGLHELGPLAKCGKRPVRISSTCTVFAGAELRDRLATGQRREDILAGLHRAIMLRAMSLLARSGGIKEEFTFSGGVANNEAAVDALRWLARENYGIEHINISPESIYTGALGAALFALREKGAGEPRKQTVGGAA